MKLIANIVLATAIAIFVLGCSGGGSANVILVRDSAGVAIREVPFDVTDARMLRLSQAPFVTIEPHQSGDYALFRVRDIGQRSDGSMVVANTGYAELLFFDPNGNYVRTAGRRGQGPGEYQNISTLAVGPHDSTYVFDSRLRRLTVLDRNGELARTNGVNHPGRGVFFGTVGVLDDGNIVLMESPRRSRAGGGPVSLPFALYEQNIRDGRMVVVGDYERAPVYRYPRGRGFTSRPIPFMSTPSFAVSGKQLAVGDGSEPQYVIQEPPGNVRSVVRWASQPRPVTAQDIARYREERINRANSDEAKQVEREVLDDIDFASRWPYYRELMVASDGLIWLRLDGPEFDGESQRWVTLGGDEGGGPASFDLTGAAVVRGIGSDYVLAVMTNELGVERIVKFQLESPAP